MAIAGQSDTQTNTEIGFFSQRKEELNKYVKDNWIPIILTFLGILFSVILVQLSIFIFSLKERTLILENEIKSIENIQQNIEILKEKNKFYQFMVVISYEYKETMTELQFAFKDELSCDKFIYTVRCMVNNNQK